jgi:hypothetical protein
MSSSQSGWLNERQRDGGVDRVILPDDVGGALFLCGKHAIAGRYESGAWDTVVCLVERHELVDRYPDYVRWLDGAGERAIWFPIPDLHAPEVDQMVELVEQLVALLRAGRRLVVHCAAGKGRAGTTAVCVLTTLGVTVDDALAQVAASRPGAGPEAGVQRELVDELAACRRE